jgi:hypothetical protein
MANCGIAKNMTGGNRKNKNKTKRNKTQGGKRMKAKGGKRSTRQLSNGASNWQGKVMKIYKEMKAKDANVRLGDAMKRASQLKKKGQL